jgi:hypothetical protein
MKVELHFHRGLWEVNRTEFAHLSLTGKPQKCQWCNSLDLDCLPKCQVFKALS